MYNLKMLRIILWCFIILLGNFRIEAQFSNRIWCFGDSAGIDFSNPTIPTTFTSAMYCRGSCCSISDSNDNLLFYAHTGNYPLWYSSTCYCAGRVQNRNHGLMQNGDSLIGEIGYDQMLIVPFPSDSTKFYLFHLAVYLLGGVYYSVIDMSANGGLGSVIQKNILLTNALFSTCSASIKHGNGRDWWVLFRPSNAQVGGPPLNEFYKYLITPGGIAGPFIENVGSLNSTDLGVMKFSHKGNRLAFVNSAGLREVYDFDRCTGIISNPINIFPEFAGWTWGAEFSPNDSLLYVSTYSNDGLILQYDLYAANIGASEKLIASIPYPDYEGGKLKLGPDNKIYWSYSWDLNGQFNYPYPDTSLAYNIYNMNLSVINNPNALDTACDFQPFSFYLGGNRTYYELPNNPDYNKPAWGGSICDTLGLPNFIYNKGHVSECELNLFYHTEWQTLFLNGSGFLGKSYSFLMIDISGKVVYNESGLLSSSYYTKNLQCDLFSSGTYMILLVTDQERMVKKFVK